jgi:hypothetical protein
MAETAIKIHLVCFWELVAVEPVRLEEMLILEHQQLEVGVRELHLLFLELQLLTQVVVVGEQPHPPEQQLDQEVREVVLMVV